MKKLASVNSTIVVAMATRFAFAVFRTMLLPKFIWQLFMHMPPYGAGVA